MTTLTSSIANYLSNIKRLHQRLESLRKLGDILQSWKRLEACKVLFYVLLQIHNALSKSQSLLTKKNPGWGFINLLPDKGCKMEREMHLLRRSSGIMGSLLTIKLRILALSKQKTRSWGFLWGMGSSSENVLFSDESTALGL